MSIRTVDLYWLAGLIEGEGCFTTSHHQSISLEIHMTDLDVMQRAGQFLGKEPKLHLAKGGRKEAWRIRLSGDRAAEWMMTLYPLMGERRQERIAELLLLWRSQTGRGNWGATRTDTGWWREAKPVNKKEMA